MSFLDDIAGRYDAFLVDQFGVLLDGSGAYPGAPAALRRLGSLGKPLILLSNSGKRSAGNEARLTTLGFPRDSYLMVLSSGEVAHRRLAADLHTGRIAPGTLVWMHGRGDDRSPIEGLALREVDAPEAAALLLLAGSRGDAVTLDAYRAALAPAAARGTPMLCLNPDREMLTPAGLRFGAGRIAEEYAALGGPVEWIGKPHPAIYAEAAALLPGIPPARVLAIGDSPAHDIAGGAAAGHATALTRTGIHAALSAVELDALCAEAGARPDHILEAFAWR